jgi:hypothetical protein
MGVVMVVMIEELLSVVGLWLLLRRLLVFDSFVFPLGPRSKPDMRGSHWSKKWRVTASYDHNTKQTTIIL